MDTAKPVIKDNVFQKKNTWRIIFAVFLLILTVFTVKTEFQNDTFYIIKLGEQILNNGIDCNDYWAWSAQLYNTYPHFLFNIILAVLYRAFGFAGIYAFVLVTGYALSISLYFMIEKVYDRTVSEKGISLYPLIGMFVSLLVIFAHKSFILARPQIITYLLWLWEAWFILCFLNTAKKRYIAVIILIVWICALVHATAWYFTFILFLPFLASAYLTRLIRFLASKGIKLDFYFIGGKFILANDSECRNVNKLWIGLIASYTTGLLTPTRICYTSIFKASSGNTIKYVIEHQPLVLANYKWLLASILLFVVLLSFFKIKCRLDLLFLYTGILIMTIISRRHLGLYIYIACFALFYLVFETLSMISEDFRKKIMNTIIPMLTLLVLAVLGLSKSSLFRFSYFDSSFVSDEAIDYLKDNYNVQNLRLYNEYSFGAYMLFRDVPVFIDSRVNEYTKEFDSDLERDVFNDYVSVIKLQDDWKEVVEHYDFDGYYISKDRPLVYVLERDSNYEKVWENSNMVIIMKVRDE